jgi:hypothetical protein
MTRDRLSRMTRLVRLALRGTPAAEFARVAPSLREEPAQLPHPDPALAVWVLEESQAAEAAEALTESQEALFVGRHLRRQLGLPMDDGLLAYREGAAACVACGGPLGAVRLRWGGRLGVVREDRCCRDCGVTVSTEQPANWGDDTVVD